MPPTDELPPLPAGAPSTWTARAPEPEDAPAVFDLAAACDEAVLGYPDVSLADVEADIGLDPHRQLLVLDGSKAVAWVWVEDRAAGRTPSDVFVDPELTADDPALADRLAQWCWDRALAAAAAIATERGVDATGVETGVLDGDAASERRASSAGFTPIRTFWRMQRDLAPDDADPRPAAGVTIRSMTAQDTRSAYEIVESAFADHWNHHPRTYDEWWRQKSGGPGFDLGLWWLAEVDGRPVGVLIASRQMADEEAMYIAIVATLREARGRGVAKALLRKAFAAGLAEGWSKAKLNVDSSSATAAPALYGTVGMTVAFTIQAWQQQVAAG